MGRPARAPPRCPNRALSRQGFYSDCYPRLLIHKLAILPNSNVNGTHLLTLRHSSQDLPRDIRQQRIGEDVVHIARAALDFCTTAGYFVEEGVVIGQLDLMIFQDAALDLA